MVYDGFDFKDLLVVEHITRSLMPPIEVANVTIPGRIGSVFTGVTLNPTKVSVDIFIIGADKDRSDVDNRVSQIVSRLVKKEPKKLTLRDKPGLFQWAVIDGDIELNRYQYTGQAKLTFNCLDPLLYDIDETVIDVGYGSNPMVYTTSAEIKPLITFYADTDSRQSLYSFKLLNGNDTVFDFVNKTGFGVSKDWSMCFDSESELIYTKHNQNGSVLYNLVPIPLDFEFPVLKPFETYDLKKRNMGDHPATATAEVNSRIKIEYRKAWYA